MLMASQNISCCTFYAGSNSNPRCLSRKVKVEGEGTYLPSNREKKEKEQLSHTAVAWGHVIRDEFHKYKTESTKALDIWINVTRRVLKATYGISEENARIELLRQVSQLKVGQFSSVTEFINKHRELKQNLIRYNYNYTGDMLATNILVGLNDDYVDFSKRWGWKRAENPPFRANGTTIGLPKLRLSQWARNHSTIYTLYKLWRT
ncbi:hypothetical protein AJ80_08748 [Polytolypa hystricis UAMH7299]|uniref:Uncharacterized protein n=1 Tax=Polytolypa hystricis (strain UAMH7299) TaxID=1447883 RepID=A0A2B7X2N8_POLH7|nr:hypothetical protein AJ80_08748 [Polytolypa hystricis UAMH7299]